MPGIIQITVTQGEVSRPQKGLLAVTTPFPDQLDQLPQVEAIPEQLEVRVQREVQEAEDPLQEVLPLVAEEIKVSK